MKTVTDKSVWVVTIPDDEFETVIFDGTRKELDEYVSALAEWNGFDKRRIKFDSSILVRPVADD